MDAQYAVTKRGPKGEPREIRCQAHPDCTWTMASAGAQKDNDPVFLAQFNRHVLDSETQDLRSLGRLRRGRK